MSDNDLIRRGDAITALGFSAWKHEGEDAYSKGMDAGARHQSQSDHDALRALPAVDDNANARLSAAAPDLLKLVELVYGSFGGGLVMSFYETDVAEFHAAIVKAKGGAK
jgi:hypothetical protein